jgi:hypothetical protein
VRLVALVTSEESSGRESSRRFYERLGYRVTGVRFSKELD